MRPARRAGQRRHVPRYGHRSRRRQGHPRRGRAERDGRRRRPDAAHAPRDHRCGDDAAGADRCEQGTHLRRRHRPGVPAHVHGDGRRREPGRPGDVDGGARSDPGHRAGPGRVLGGVQRRRARALHGQGQEGPRARVHGRALDREQAGDRVSGVPARRPRPGDGRVPAGAARAPRRAGLGARARRERRDGQDQAAERVPGRGARPPAPGLVVRAVRVVGRLPADPAAPAAPAGGGTGCDRGRGEVAGGRRPPSPRPAALAAAARGRGRRRGPDDPGGPGPGGRVPPRRSSPR